MRALITGINGFVGTYLRQELTSHNWEVFGLSDNPPFNDRVLEGNILDRSRIQTILRKVNPEVVFHLAGFTSVSASWNDPELALRVNRDGTLFLYESSARQQQPPAVLITSSAEVYGIPRKTPIPETHPLNPLNPYAVSKLAQERVAQKYPSIRTVISRGFPHTGPGQASTFVVSDFARQVARVEKGLQETIAVGNLEARRDYLDVRDVVRAYRLLTEKECWGDIYNVCSGTVYSIKQLLQELVKLAQPGVKVPIVTDSLRIRPNDIPILHGDNRKLVNATGWRPRISISSTLHDVLTYWRSAEK